MNLSNEIVSTLKQAEKFSGLFLLVSNSREYITAKAKSFIIELLDMTPEQETLNFREFTSFDGSISVDTVNSLISFEMRKVVGARSKGILLHDVELFKDSTSDKLLKTIEECNRDSLIVFTTTNISMVSPTIRSRSTIFYDFTDDIEFFVKTRNKFLGFLSDVPSLDFDQLESCIQNAQNLGIFNVIKALFVNAETLEQISLAKILLNLYTESTKEDNLCAYLIYKVFGDKIKI